MKKIFTFTLGLYTAMLVAQNPVVDSLKLALESSHDHFHSAKINLSLAKAFERIDIAQGKVYAFAAYHYKDSDSLLGEANIQLGRYHFFTAQLDSAVFYFNNAKRVYHQLDDPKRIASINISLGAIQLRKGEYLNTITTLTESASYFESIKDSLNSAKCYSNIATAFAELERYPKAIEYSTKALTIFRKKKVTQFEMITLPNLATQHYKNGDTLAAVRINAEAEALALELNDKRSLSMIYNNLGDIYLNKDPTKAEEYLNKTLVLKNELNLIKGIEVTQSNLGYLHLKKKEYRTAISYFEQAQRQVKGKQLVLVFNNLKEAYVGLNAPNKALEFSEKARTLNDSLLNAESQKSFMEIQAQYETEKKEKEILELKSINREVEYQRGINRNYFIGALAAFLLTIIVTYLLIKNAKRKQVIALQKEKIKNQVFEQELKAQELNGIDEILNAQEKERSKIAADLHDNLGSKVATLKLYLDSFNDKDGFDTFYEKLKNIVNNTYDDIRKIGSNKNFGALINKGLIPSTQAIASQISDSKKINIIVINVDVEKRIENTIEIQIFRIIQELLTNIIKHSKATEAIIQFSEHENVLNIIVEDNGLGFQIEGPRSGVGLSNIEKRVNKINGEFVIDSTLNHGTTIILNIPL